MDGPMSSGTGDGGDVHDEETWDGLNIESQFWDAFPSLDEEPEPEPEYGDFPWPEVDDEEM